MMRDEAVEKLLELAKDRVAVVDKEYGCMHTYEQALKLTHCDAHADAVELSEICRAARKGQHTPFTKLGHYEYGYRIGDTDVWAEDFGRDGSWTPYMREFGMPNITLWDQSNEQETVETIRAALHNAGVNGQIIRREVVVYTYEARVISGMVNESAKTFTNRGTRVKRCKDKLRSIYLGMGRKHPTCAFPPGHPGNHHDGAYSWGTGTKTPEEAAEWQRLLDDWRRGRGWN